MLCSDDDVLEKRLKEYARYFTMSGWDFKIALEELRRGADKDRRTIITQPRKQKPKKVAWVTTYDPRCPSKTSIIKENLNILYSNPQNRSIFPEGTIIGADRRRKNLAEMYKPTVPRKFPQHGPKHKPGFFVCKAKRCDVCSHSSDVTGFKSPWDKRYWPIRQHLTCTSNCCIYLIRCRLHADLWYVGSTTNYKRRWANHKSDSNRKLLHRCGVARHVSEIEHPSDNQLPFLTIHMLEEVASEDLLTAREIYWQANLGTIFTGLNSRMELNRMTRTGNRIQY
jgi:hypothetical protein